MKALIIEDNKVDQKILERVLSSSCESIEIHECNKEAQSAYFKNKYDLIVLDLHLPDCFGIDILPTLIKSQPKECKVVVVSAEDHMADYNYMYSLGVHKCYKKPETNEGYKEIEEEIGELLSVL